MQPFKPVMNSVHMQSNRPAVPIQDKMSMQQTVPQEDDKNCQSTNYYGSMCADKKYQATNCYKKVDKNWQESINMQPVKPKMDMWSKKPAKLPSSYKKKYQDDFKSQSAMCSDKKCQEIPNVQKRTKKPISHMWSVTKTNDMWLPKPAVLYQYRRLCNGKNCQSTRCYKKKSYDKN